MGFFSKKKVIKEKEKTINMNYSKVCEEIKKLKVINIPINEFEKLKSFEKKILSNFKFKDQYGEATFKGPIILKEMRYKKFVENFNAELEKNKLIFSNFNHDYVTDNSDYNNYSTLYKKTIFSIIGLHAWAKQNKIPSSEQENIKLDLMLYSKSKALDFFIIKTSKDMIDMLGNDETSLERKVKNRLGFLNKKSAVAQNQEDLFGNFKLLSKEVKKSLMLFEKIDYAVEAAIKDEEKPKNKAIYNSFKASFEEMTNGFFYSKKFEKLENAFEKLILLRSGISDNEKNKNHIDLIRHLECIYRAKNILKIVVKLSKKSRSIFFLQKLKENLLNVSKEISKTKERFESSSNDDKIPTLDFMKKLERVMGDSIIKSNFNDLYNETTEKVKELVSFKDKVLDFIKNRNAARLKVWWDNNKNIIKFIVGMIGKVVGILL